MLNIGLLLPLLLLMMLMLTLTPMEMAEQKKGLIIEIITDYGHSSGLCGVMLAG